MAAHCIGSPNDGQSGEEFRSTRNRVPLSWGFLAGDYER